MDSILKVLEERSILNFFVQGARSALGRTLGIKGILIETDESAKRTQDANADANQSSQPLLYPYAYMTLSDLQGIREQSNTRASSRIGSRLGQVGVTRATSQVGRLFPVKLGFTFKYRHNDPLKALLFAEACAILSVTGGIPFQLILSREHNVYLDGCVEIPDSLSIPLADSGNPQEPGALQLDVNMVLRGYCGFIDTVAAVNSTNPISSIDEMVKLTGEHHAL